MIRYKPTTSSRRFRTKSSGVYKAKPYKPLTFSQKASGGRNNLGRMTMRFRGGGHKRRIRQIDFKRDKWDVKGIVQTVEYDPGRSCRISLVKYADGDVRYILHPEGLHVGRFVISSKNKAALKLGNAMPISFIPGGTLVHNIEMIPGAGGAIARSAAGCASIMSKDEKYAVLKMPSGEIRKVFVNSMATIGRLDNIEHSAENLGCAGSNRHRGRRPHVRGTAMNAVDHPHGGGRGRSHGSNVPRSPTGVPAKGFKTRKRRKSSSKMIISRKKRR
ncbi:MAG: 50S ribosomal protein L2 [Elusimicrobia bacterium CG08_land_8_20_14_0_20_44_26]|nr:MAG: 50S ribosomal protein L2 [Elusimicrobia bacterium CG08_land_8_20_14_0_20_44_26]